MGLAVAALAGMILLSSARAAQGRETVFLVHGMGRTRASLVLLAWRLRRAGYRTVSVRYSQVGESLDEITERLRRTAAREAIAEGAACRRTKRQSASKASWSSRLKARLKCLQSSRSMSSARTMVGSVRPMSSPAAWAESPTAL